MEIGAVSPCPWTDFWAMPLDPPMLFFFFFSFFSFLFAPPPPSVTTFNFSVYLLSLYTTFSFFTLSWPRWRRGSSHRRPWRHLRWLDHSACWCRGRACRLPAITQLVLLSGNCFNLNRTQNDHYILINRPSKHSEQLPFLVGAGYGQGQAKNWHAVITFASQV